MDEKSSEEFSNFLQKVEEVDDIIMGLSSGDNKVSERATIKADLFLKELSDNACIDEENVHVKTSRTVINCAAISDCGNQDTISPEAFMRSVEKDAKARAQDKQERKEEAERLKALGNKAFRNKEYNKALNFFNKAIEQIKDSNLLYTNRALTFIKLGLYFRGLNDCESALKICDTSLKAHLYKAQCLFQLKVFDEAESVLQNAIDFHPKHKSLIEEYGAKWKVTNSE